MTYLVLAEDSAQFKKYLSHRLGYKVILESGTYTYSHKGKHNYILSNIEMFNDFPILKTDKFKIIFCRARHFTIEDYFKSETIELQELDCELGHDKVNKLIKEMQIWDDPDGEYFKVSIFKELG